MTHYSHNGTYPRATAPHKIRLADGTTRTDPTQYLVDLTPDELVGAGVLVTSDPPIYDPATQTRTWTGTGTQTDADWLVANKSAETLAAELSDAKTSAVSQITARYQQAMSGIAAAYPPEEREGWTEQVEGANAVIGGGSSSLIDALRAATGETAGEMAAVILAKREVYRGLYGAATGRKRALLFQAEAAADVAALSLIDISAGWPV